MDITFFLAVSTPKPTVRQWKFDLLLYLISKDKWPLQLVKGSLQNILLSEKKSQASSFPPFTVFLLS